MWRNPKTSLGEHSPSSSENVTRRSGIDGNGSFGSDPMSYHAIRDELAAHTRTRVIQGYMDLFSNVFRGPAPSVVSDTSAEAASKVTDPMRARSYRKIIATLAAYGAQTRERISFLTGLKESSLCARLWELRPTWVRVNSGAGKSACGLTVDTYELTAAARQRWKEAA